MLNKILFTNIYNIDMAANVNQVRTLILVRELNIKNRYHKSWEKGYKEQ